jgi:hypothetical protein
MSSMSSTTHPIAHTVSEVKVAHSVRPELHREFLTIDCPNGWADVTKLTWKVLEYEGRRFTLSSWDIDRNECHFVRSTMWDIPQKTARILSI